MKHADCRCLHNNSSQAIEVAQSPEKGTAHSDVMNLVRNWQVSVDGITISCNSTSKIRNQADQIMHYLWSVVVELEQGTWIAFELIQAYMKA